MAAGGTKSATFAGSHTDGLITSVKDPAETLESVIRPYREASEGAGRTSTVMATHWVVFAGDEEEAWEALASMRGLRAPGRLEEVDPAVLRERADKMSRSEILARYTVVSEPEELVDAYAPLVTELAADYVAIQVASLDPTKTLRLIGESVLPRLQAMGENRPPAAE